MLILSRRIGERTNLFTRIAGERISLGSVLVTAIEMGGKVKLGFDLPHHIEIEREEITDARAKQEGVA